MPSLRGLIQLWELQWTVEKRWADPFQITWIQTLNKFSIFFQVESNQAKDKSQLTLLLSVMLIIDLKLKGLDRYAVITTLPTGWPSWSTAKHLLKYSPLEMTSQRPLNELSDVKRQTIGLTMVRVMISNDVKSWEWDNSTTPSYDTFGLYYVFVL